MTDLADERFAFRVLSAQRRLPSLADDVRRGLTMVPKRLSPKFFYDELGSRIFQAICVLPEYRVARTEAGILEACGDEIASSLGSGPIRLVELGGGGGEKTRTLIEAILRGQPSLEYITLDISGEALRTSANELLRRYPALRVSALEGDFEQDLGAVRRLLEDRTAGVRDLVIFLGSTIGNLEPPNAVELLRAMRGLLGSGDAVLLGADMTRDEEVLIPAYDDPTGVTAAFNLNLLARINRELGGEFDLRSFRHRVRYDHERGRVELHLASVKRQVVVIRELALEIAFEPEETIHTENSYKFDSRQIEAMANEAGLRVHRAWQDDARTFQATLMVVPRGDVVRGRTT